MPEIGARSVGCVCVCVCVCMGVGCVSWSVKGAVTSCSESLLVLRKKAVVV